jgi:hypothetical protein
VAAIESETPAEAKLSSLARHSLVYSIAPLAQRLVAAPRHTSRSFRISALLPEW